MTAQTHSRAFLSRLAIAGAFLLAGLSATGAAAASPLIPLEDAGGGGGGGAVADSPIMLEELGLVSTNDGPGSFSMHPELDGPTLVGSGPEREIVANSDRQERAGVIDETARARDLIAISGSGDTATSGTLDGPTLVGSGPEREIVANSDRQEQARIFDETGRATNLIALTPDGTTTAAARHGLPY